MTVRDYRPDDLRHFQRMHEAMGFDYLLPDFDKMEAVKVVVDENDLPLAAAGAEKILQLYFLCGKFEHPAAQLHSITLLHAAMAPPLREKGYHEVNAFLPPSIARSFGRRLERTFGWSKNWLSWYLSY
jgi:hypothetical protein